jgi:hypothetical protein
MESIVIYLNDVIFLELDKEIKQSTTRKIFTYYDINTAAIHDKIWNQTATMIKQQLINDN